MRAAAIAAARADLPWTLTASFDTAGRTTMGMLPEAFAAFARSLPTQPLAIGANGGVRAADLLVSILGITRAEGDTPVIAKANAGVPVVDGDRVVYSGKVETMELNAHLAMDAGPRIIGGCCGTTPASHRHLEIYLAHAQCSDIVWAAPGVGGKPAADAIAMSAIEYDTTVDGLPAHPTLVSVTNVNSPRRVDEETLDNIVDMDRHGQCVVITPVTLMGVMPPVTLAQQTAEAMGSIAQVQTIRAGYPPAPGALTSNMDMRAGSPAFGTPDDLRATPGGAQTARALKTPPRSYAFCASPAADAQAAWETGFSLRASIMSHSHPINHATGWLEGGLAADFEKVIIEAETPRARAAMLKPISFTDDDLAVEAILATPPGGHFFGSPHTMSRYENAFWRTLLADWSNFENWRDAGAKDATVRSAEVWARTLSSDRSLALAPATDEVLCAYVAAHKNEIGA